MLCGGYQRYRNIHSALLWGALHLGSRRQEGLDDYRMRAGELTAESPWGWNTVLQGGSDARIDLRGEQVRREFPAERPHIYHEVRASPLGSRAPCGVRPPESEVPGQITKLLEPQVGGCRGAMIAPLSLGARVGFQDKAGSMIPGHGRYWINVSPSFFPAPTPLSILPPGPPSPQGTGLRSHLVGTKSTHLPTFFKCFYSTQTRARATCHGPGTPISALFVPPPVPARN